MTNKTWFLIAVAIVLGGIYAFSFTDWINVPAIQIIKSDRPLRNPRFQLPVHPIAFTFDGRYALTSLQIFEANALATNKHAKPIWHLVAKSRSRSEPVKGFVYGLPIRGMRPAVTNAPLVLLEPEVPYRLVVQAGRARGQLNFKATAAGAD
jgi:hypothetical protein